jgi:hypothetical protein
MPKNEFTPILTNACIEHLNWMGCFLWRTNSTGIYDQTAGRFRKSHSIKGVPDILGLGPNGQFIGIEIKSGTDRLSEDQKKFRDFTLKKKGIYWVVKNYTDLQELKDHIFGLQKRKLPISKTTRTSEEISREEQRISQALQSKQEAVEANKQKREASERNRSISEPTESKT